MEHDIIPAGERHGPNQWEVANQAARLALTTSSTNVGQTCWQKSDNTQWVCTGAGAWAQIGGANATIPFSTTIPFDRRGETWMEVGTVAGPMTFTPNLSGAVIGASVNVALLGDGVNVPTFSGFSEWGSSSDYLDDEVNSVRFWYDGVAPRYEISGPMSLISVPGKPTGITATAGEGFVSVSFTPPVNDGGASVDRFRVTLSTGPTGEGTSSPIVVETTAIEATTATVSARNSEGWGPESDASTSVTPTPPYILAGNRGSMPAGTITNTGGLRYFNDRHSMTNRSGTPINKIRLFFVNQEGDGLVSRAGSQTFNMEAGFGIETNSQSLPRERMTFSGGNQATLGPDVGVWSDPIELPDDLPHGVALGFVVNTGYPTAAPTRLVASGTPSSRSTIDVNEASVTSITNKAVSGLMSGRAENRHINGPVAMIGVPTLGLSAATQPRILAVGDSIPAGANDTTTGLGLTGFVQRGLATTPFVTTAMSGYSIAAAFSNSPDPSPDFLRKTMMIGAGVKFTHAFVCLGGNDVRSGSDAATMLSSLNYMRLWFAARGIKMIPCTGLPRTNEANNAVNDVDAPGAMAQYMIFTEAIRENNGFGNGYFDRHALLGDPADPTKWRTDLGGPVQDNDGIHLRALGHTILANALTAAIPTTFALS